MAKQLAENNDQNKSHLGAMWALIEIVIGWMMDSGIVSYRIISCKYSEGIWSLNMYLITLLQSYHEKYVFSTPDFVRWPWSQRTLA